MGFFQRRFLPLLSFFDAYWPTLLAIAAGGVGLLYFQALWEGGFWKKILALVIIGAFAWSQIEQQKRGKSVEVLMQENDALKKVVVGRAEDYREIWSGRLKELATALSFDGSKRISFYRYSE